MNDKISLDLANHYYLLCLPGTQGQLLFPSVFAYDVFLHQLENIEGIRIHAYALFPESAVLLVHCGSAPSLWIDRFLLTYNTWYQEVTGYSGFVFDDQHQECQLVQPRLLPRLVKYVHHIPVKQKYCTAPQQYTYSSFHDYMSVRNTGVEINTVLSTISPHFGQRVRRFFDYMTDTTRDIDTIKTHEYYHAYADQAYLAKALSQYQSRKHIEYDDSHWHPIWDNCLHQLSELLDIKEGYLTGRSRHHHFVDAHFLMAWCFINCFGGPVYYAAKQLDYDETSIRLNLKGIELHHHAQFLQNIKRKLAQTHAA